MSMIPKGGDTIWGGLDWSPEESYIPRKTKQGNDTLSKGQRNINYGRIISFGKEVAKAHSSEIEMIDFRVRFIFSFYVDTRFRGNQILQSFL